MGSVSDIQTCLHILTITRRKVPMTKSLGIRTIVCFTHFRLCIRDAIVTISKSRRELNEGTPYQRFWLLPLRTSCGCSNGDVDVCPCGLARALVPHSVTLNMQMQVASLAVFHIQSCHRYSIPHLFNIEGLISYNVLMFQFPQNVVLFMDPFSNPLVCKVYRLPSEQLRSDQLNNPM